MRRLFSWTFVFFIEIIRCRLYFYWALLERDVNLQNNAGEKWCWKLSLLTVIKEGSSEFIFQWRRRTFFYLTPWWANCHGGLVAFTDGGPWCYMVGHHWHILPSCRFSLFSIEKVSVKKFSFCIQISLKLWDKIHTRDNAGKCKIILNFSASCRIIHRAALAATNPMKPPQWHIVSILHFIVIVIVIVIV